MSDVFIQHYIKVCEGQYKIGIRSFIHRGARLYQAYVMEGVHINYQTQGTRSEVFRSLKNLFGMYAVVDNEIDGF